MPYSVVDKPSKYFNTITYTGTGSSLAITGVGFQPDWVWIKSRSTAVSNVVFDVVRGVNNRLETDTTAVETFNANALTSFDTDGFTVGSGSSRWNNNALTYASWNWKANGAGVSNTSGTITSTVSANTTAGFSVVTYTGNSTAGATIGHGLGVAPSMIFTKTRSTALGNWGVYHASLGATKGLNLNNTIAAATLIQFWNNTAPTSNVFSVGTSNDVNGASTYVAYCFAEVKGYSKAGSWTGNGSADGTFIYTGFKPAMIFHKRTDSTGDWRIWDNKRSNFNIVNKILYPSASASEGTETFGDFVSNGFKIRTSGTDYNASGGTYIYMAFAENPFVSSKGIPCTAR